jgi:hypothetical protein
MLRRFADRPESIVAVEGIRPRGLSGARRIEACDGGRVAQTLARDEGHAFDVPRAALERGCDGIAGRFPLRHVRAPGKKRDGEDR